MTRVEYSVCCPQPPKITPLRGAIVRDAAFAPAEARSRSRMLILRPPQAAARKRSPILKMESGIKKFYPQK